jgi:hypothetical protein
MIRLLVEHGVSIGADALLMAMKRKQVDVLRTLLDSGEGPNMRCEAVSREPNTKTRRRGNNACSDLTSPTAKRDTQCSETNHRYFELQSCL